MAAPVAARRRLALPRADVAVARVALAGLALAGLAIALLAAAAPSGLIPSSWRGMPGWLAGPLPGIGDGIGAAEFSTLFMVMCACYLVALVVPLEPRAAVATIAGLHVVFMLAPPLLSSDVFGYIDWARLGTLHGLDPYAHGSLSAPQDPAFEYFRWRTDMASPYGPVFTVASYATVPLGLAGAFWAFKVACAAAGLATVALVASCARRLGVDPVRAAVFVGLNPLVLVWAVGGAHNDLLAVVLVMAGVRLALDARERASGATLLVAAAVKASAGVVLPYAIAGARGGARVTAGAAVAGAAVLALGLAVFGTDLTGLVETNRDQQDWVAKSSVPNQVGLLLGAGGITPAIRTIATVVLVGAVIWTLVRAWRGADWIACAGWGTFALIACSAWVMPWYVVWLLPLAAIGRDRRLAVATLGLCAFLIAMRTPF